MRKIIMNILLISAVFIFTACSGSPYRQVKPNEVIESKHVSYVVPDSNWEIIKTYDRSTWKLEKGTPSINHITENIQFSIYTYDYHKGWQEELFKKNGHYYDSDITKEIFSKNDKETGLTYKKGWITYVKYLKCTGGVFSRGFGGSYYSGGVKFYTMTCGYYDKTETKNDGRKTLKIDYRYTHNTKNPQEAKEREQTIKEAVKKAVSTLKIKNIDIKRMEKEGLMHYDKEFESTKW